MVEEPAALRRQAQTALEGEHLRKATRLLKRLVELEPERVSNRLDLGRLLMRRDKPHRALPYLERICQQAPEGAPGAVFFQAQGDCLQALAQQEQAKEKNEAAREHFEAALEAYDEALEHNPEDAVVWNNRGFTNFSLGRFNEAIRCYDESIRLAPGYAVAWYNRGYTLQIAGQLNQARQYYERSVELNPQDAVAWNNLGNVYYNQGHYERAIDIFKRSLELEPNYTIAINNIGNALDHLNRYHESIGYHQKTLDLDPTFHYAWMAKGRALTRLGQPEEGLELIETSIELESEDGDYHVALGDALRALGRPQASRAAYNEALKLNEADGHAWEGLAGLAEQEGDRVKALRFYDQAVRSYDGNARRRDLDQDWVLKAGALEQVGFSAEALNQYRNALVMVPLSACANLSRGRLLEALDRWVEALEAYQAARQAQVQLARNATAREHGFRVQQALLGESRCLQELGRSDEALARLEQLFKELDLAEHEVERDSRLAGSDLGLTRPLPSSSPAVPGGDPLPAEVGERGSSAGTAEAGSQEEERESDEVEPDEAGDEVEPGDGSEDGDEVEPGEDEDDKDDDDDDGELPTMELTRIQMEAEAHALRGQLLGRTGDLLEAATSYQKAARVLTHLYARELELLPTRTPDRSAQAAAHTEAALNLKELGRHEQALEQAEAALALVSDELLPWLVAGELYLETEAFDQAAGAFDGALGVAPRDETALVGRARAHLGQGHQRRALELARIAVDTAPELPAVWQVLKEAAEVGGNQEELGRAQRELARLAAMTERVAAVPESAEESCGESILAEDEETVPRAQLPANHADEPEDDELLDTADLGPAGDERFCLSCGVLSPITEEVREGQHTCPSCGVIENEGWTGV